MLYLFNHEFLWWSWLILGFILIIIEIFTGTFILLSLGISAIIVGIIAGISDTSLSIEILIFTLLSMLLIWAWKRWIKPPKSSTIGQSNHTYDTLGTTITEIDVNKRGEVKFDTPVLGNSLWTAISNENIPKNMRIEIVDINGQLILVKPLSPTH